MILHELVKATPIAAPAQAVFDWHKNPEALQQLIPPWESVTLEAMTGPIWEEGSRVTLKIHALGPIALRWVSEHRHYKEGQQFQDVQVSGPFAFWEHTHAVRATGSNACVLEDRIRYALPLGRLGDVFGHWFVRRKLARMFEFRHQVVLAAFGAGA